MSQCLRLLYVRICTYAEALALFINGKLKNLCITAMFTCMTKSKNQEFYSSSKNCSGTNMFSSSNNFVISLKSYSPTALATCKT